MEWGKFFDKSDNEGSIVSMSGVGPKSKKTKLSNYHSNVNEPIKEEEDEKEELAENASKLIS